MADFKSQLTVALVFSIWLKLMTFILTMYLTRQLSPEYSGVNFTYSVFIEAILFVAREAPQNTALRYNLTENGNDTARKTESNITGDNYAVRIENSNCKENDVCDRAHDDKEEKDDEDNNTEKVPCQPTERVKDQQDTSKTVNNSTKLNYNSISHKAVVEQINFSFVSIPLAIVCICLCELQTLTPLQLFPALSPMWSGSTTNLATTNNTMNYNTSIIKNNIINSNKEVYQGNWIKLTMTVPSLLLSRLPELAVYLSVCLFALAQPAMVLLQSLDIYRAHVLAEFWTTVVRLMTTILLITFNHHGIHSDWEGRMIFALSHLASAFTFVLYYIVVSVPLSS